MERSNVRRGVAASAVALCVLLAALVSLRDAGAANGSVSIASFAFSPDSVTVNAGESVTWTNNQAGVTHTVTSDTGAFDSGGMSGGGTFQQTFPTAGTYAYHCSIHPTMQGTVTVVSSTAPAGTSTVASTATQPAATNTPVTPTASAVTATATSTVAAPTATPTQPAPTNTVAPQPTSTTAAATATRPSTTVLPPNTGSGSDGGGSSLPLMAALAFAVVAAAGAGAFVLRRRRAAR